MKAILTVHGRNGELDAATLRTWLEKVDGVSIEPDPLAEGSRMGATEVVNLVLSNVVAIGGLVLGYANWRLASRRRSDGAVLRVHIEGSPVTFELRDASPEAVREMIDKVAASGTDGVEPEPAKVHNAGS